MTNYIDIPENPTLEQIGLDQFGQSPLSFAGSEVNKKAQTMFEAGVPSNFIQDGDIIRRLNLIDGWLQSNNFVTGSTGWRIDSDGNVEFDSGYFRGDITGASGTFSGTVTVGFADIGAGTNANALNIGHGNVKLDGANKRIIINDGTNDRILIGYAQNKF